MNTYQFNQWRKIPEDWIHKNMAVITWNVSSIQYCLLLVLVAALLLVSCSAFEKWYPDPLDCYKYYLLIDDSLYHLTCPNSLVFDRDKKFTLNDCTILYITPLNGSDFNQNMEGYYCESPSNFTYCTPDGLKIVDNPFCPIGLSCLGPNYTNLCVL